MWIYVDTYMGIYICGYIYVDIYMHVLRDVSEMLLLMTKFKQQDYTTAWSKDLCTHTRTAVHCHQQCNPQLSHCQPSAI